MMAASRTEQQGSALSTYAEESRKKDKGNVFLNLPWNDRQQEEPLLSEEDTRNDSEAWFPEAAKDPWLPSLTKTQRLYGFILSLLAGSVCMFLAYFYIPFLIFKARKFVALYTLGSVFLILSFSFLWGPWNHLKHLFSKERLPFTLVYFGSLSVTLYVATSLQSTILTIICALIQIIALIWFLMSHIPGGEKGFRFMTRIFSAAVVSTAKKTLPV